MPPKLIVLANQDQFPRLHGCGDANKKAQKGLVTRTLFIKRQIAVLHLKWNSIHLHWFGAATEICMARYHRVEKCVIL